MNAASAESRTKPYTGYVYAGLVLAVGCWFYLHVTSARDLPMAAYEREVAAQNAHDSILARRSVPVDEAALTALALDPRAVAAGREAFRANCVPCHGAEGEGAPVGPNLTDEYWLHGGGAERVYRSVNDGFIVRGMPAWGPTLGARRIQTLTAYLLTIRNRRVAGGRSPQGTRESGP